MIKGVRTGRIVRHVDERGSFREVWRASWFEGRQFVQANVSISAAGVLRGLHVHRTQDDQWVVVRGRAFVALVDIRPPLSGGPPLVEGIELGADDWCYIPAGVAHGFLALDELELLYLVTSLYDGSDEFGFAWNDPDAAIPWPHAPEAAWQPVVSDRDRANPSLREMLARLRA
jgi:dTDP-4-dehydrorhamnose 3,5-epimerase